MKLDLWYLCPLWIVFTFFSFFLVSDPCLLESIFMLFPSGSSIWSLELRGTMEFKLIEGALLYVLFLFYLLLICSLLTLIFEWLLIFDFELVCYFSLELLFKFVLELLVVANLEILHFFSLILTVLYWSSSSDVTSLLMMEFAFFILTNSTWIDTLRSILPLFLFLIFLFYRSVIVISSFYIVSAGWASAMLTWLSSLMV